MISNRSIPTARARTVLAVAISLGALAAVGPPAQAQAPAPETRVVDHFEIQGFIDRVAFRFLQERVQDASRSGAAMVVVRLDSPGGLGVDPQEVKRLMRDSRVPVVMWIAPAGARAEGLAAHLALEAHALAMAPGSRIGRAEPHDASGESDPASRPDLEVTSQFSLRDKVMGSRDATRFEVADLVASSTSELLLALSGMDLADGARLPEGPFDLRFHGMGIIAGLQHSAARPVAAYLLLILAIFGIVFEMYNPGVGGAALFGGISLAFGVHALSVLPTNWYAAGLLAVGLAFLLLDLRSGGFGRGTAAGAVFFLSGSLALFDSPVPSASLPRWASATGTAMVLLFFLSAMTAAVRARGARPITGSEGLVGTRGTARTDIAPGGQVMARGTLWRARTLGAAIAQGSEVEIRGVSGLMLIVEPAGGSADEGP